MGTAGRDLRVLDGKFQPILLLKKDLSGKDNYSYVNLLEKEFFGLMTSCC